MYKPITRRLSTSFGFQQLFYGLRNNKSKCIGMGSFFFALPAKRKPACLFNPSRKIRLETGSISHKCVSRNTMSSNSEANLVLYPFSMTDDKLTRPLLYVNEQYSRAVIIYYKKSIMRPDHIWKWLGHFFAQLLSLKAIITNHNRSAKFLRWQQPNRPGESLSFRLALTRWNEAFCY